MDKKEKKVGYLLTGKIQDKLIKTMELLESEGVKPTNQVMIEVLRVMHSQGEVLELSEKDIAETVKKIVPDGGKILHIKKGDSDDTRS